MERGIGAPRAPDVIVRDNELVERYGMIDQKFEPEKLRPAEYVCEPDPRNLTVVRIDLTNGTSRDIELADHHECVLCMLACRKTS